MARQQRIYRSELPPRLQNKGFIRKQRRIYERIDGKFVGIGFKLTMSKAGDDRRDVYFVADEELKNYYFSK